MDKISAAFLITLMLVLSGCQNTPVSPQGSKISFSPSVSPDFAEPTVPSDSPQSTAINEVEQEIQYFYHFYHPKFAPGFIKKSLKDLENDSVAVVKATPIESKPNPDLDPHDAITLTTLRIDEVFISDGIVQVNETYTLVEYYRKEEVIPNSVIVHIYSTDDSLPLRRNQQYLIFLHESPQDFADYSIAGAWQGRFPINEKTIKLKLSDLTAADMEFPEEKADAILWQLAAAAFKKYLPETK